MGVASELVQCNTVPNYNRRQLDLVLSSHDDGVSVAMADETLRTVTRTTRCSLSPSPLPPPPLRLQRRYPPP
ncbi:unnamed protein product [Euphydryas editha]|uniref:Uncharacterized protein n=1 Tax=Euphydryas editha TaxID=104508 RepID=A0AAU9UUH3_EUPED|nr:unnamed protein product [Euphydryas editha]